MILSENASLIMLVQGLPIAWKVHTEFLGLPSFLVTGTCVSVQPQNYLAFFAASSSDAALPFSAQTPLSYFPQRTHTVPPYSDRSHLVNNLLIFEKLHSTEIPV